jgi:chemotaxis protein MotB
MGTPATPPPIIVIKRKKGGHAGHHGGAWKVAYADFVTAMMALFIVLWLLSSSAKVKEAVSSYFHDPTGSGKEAGSSMSGSGNGIAVGKDDMGKLKEKLEAAMKEVPKFDSIKQNVEMTVTNEGLRIELLEQEGGMFFQSGNATPTGNGADLIQKLAEQLGALDNKLLIEGHTDAKPYASDKGYSNWELSTDRANSARRILQEHGVKPDQVVQVRGFAAQQLREPNNPEAPLNRRISVLVQYRNAPPAAKEGDKKEGGEHGAKPAEHGEKKEAPKGGH